jgi:hypothetical protein
MRRGSALFCPFFSAAGVKSSCISLPVAARRRVQEFNQVREGNFNGKESG